MNTGDHRQKKPEQVIGKGDKLICRRWRR